MSQDEMQVGALAIDKPLLLWINDGLMAVFFFLIALEVKREFMEGELASREQFVMRGGSFNSPPELLRSADRVRTETRTRSFSPGFRVARELK